MYVGPDVTIGPDTMIHPNVYLEGRTRIGSRCEIHSGVRIIDSTLDDGVVINNFCVIVSSSVARGAQVGPFAQLRPTRRVGEDAHIGNFVELKKTLGRQGLESHAPLVSGDATIGERVNVGAGTITCNYDGTTKHPTVIEDGAFIGSDSQLVAPVRVGRAPTSRPDRRLPKTCPRARWPSRAASRPTRKAGSSEEEGTGLGIGTRED